MNDEAWTAYLRDLAPGLVLRSGSSYYLGIPAAQAALDWLLANDVAVLGADGINTDGRHIFPSMSHILDLSTMERSGPDDARRTIEETRSVLAGWMGQVEFVDLVVDLQVTLAHAD